MRTLDGECGHRAESHGTCYLGIPLLDDDHIFNAFVEYGLLFETVGRMFYYVRP
jgi:hypothetical protein